MRIRKDFDIINVFRKNLLKELTFNEILAISKKKSRNWVFNLLQEFVNIGIITKRKVNNSYLYKANLNSSLLLKYFGTWNFNDSYKFVHFKLGVENYNIILELMGKIKKITPFFIFLIFGSYAEGKAKKNSDIDTAFIVESKNVRKKILPYIEQIAKRSIPSLDYHIFTKDEFKEMLLRKEENLGKEIYKKSILLWGDDQYYELIREAEENGFKD